MRPSVLAIVATAILVMAACGTTTTPSVPPTAPASPSAGPSDPAPSPSQPASTPSAPAPSPVEPTPTPAEPSVAPEPAEPTAEEQALLDGVARDDLECAPTADLPAGAIAGIECSSSDPAIDQVGFYRFADEASMVAAYTARMLSEGVVMDSGSCRDGEHESAYTPGEEPLPHRNGCFINDQGFANYRLTLLGNVYVGILGTSDDIVVLEDYAWRGNQDVPGGPTIWSESPA